MRRVCMQPIAPKFWELQNIYLEMKFSDLLGNIGKIVSHGFL